MKYKGIELKEITEPQIFDPPKKMLVWDNCSNIAELDVYAIIGRSDFRVICESSSWRHCAEIPSSLPELKPITERELARWLANGNGEVKSASTIYSHWNYYPESENKSIPNYFTVRKWYDTEWHKPTREYLGLED